MKRHDNSHNNPRQLGLEGISEEIALEVIAIIHIATETWAKGVQL